MDTVLTVIAYLTSATLLLDGFAIAANDVAIGIGGPVATQTTPMKRGLLLAAVLGVVSVLMLAEPPSAVWVERLFETVPDWQPLDKALALFCALFATGLTMLALSGVGWPGAGILVLGGTFLGLSVSGAAGTLWMTILVAWLFGMLVLPVAAGLLALGIHRIFRWYVAEFWRPRDRLAVFLPLAMGALAALAALLPPTLYLVDLPNRISTLVIVAAVVVTAAGCVAALARFLIRRHPFWVDNDEKGAEQAFHKPQLVAAAIATLGFGAYQAMAMAAPARLVYELASRGEDDASGYATTLRIFLPLAIGIFAGTLLLGHRSCERLATPAALTRVSGFSAQLGTLSALLGSAGLGLPAIGRPAVDVAFSMAGELDGLAAVLKRYAAHAAVATAAMLAAGILAMALNGLCRVLLTATNFD